MLNNELKFDLSSRASGWNGTTYGTDVEVSYTIKGVDTGGGAHSYLLVQMPDPAMATFTGYVLDFEFLSGGALMNVILYRGNSGSFTVLHTVTSVPYATGDVFTFRQVGNDLSGLINGVLIGTFPYTDSSPLNASGTYVGCGGYGATLLSFDDFTAGDPTASSGLVLSGIKEAAKTRAGSVISELVVSGADVFTPAELGSLISALVASGADVFSPSETGSIISALVSSGADTFTAADTGTLVSALVLSGADALTAAETGSIISALVGSGADVFTPAETGAIISALVASGLDVDTYNRTGSVISALVASGADTFTPGELGSIISALVASGTDALTAAETGSLISTLVASRD